MANLSNIARPYALAAFEVARDKQQLPAWKAFLESAKIAAENPALNRMLGNPEITSEKLFDIFQGVLASQLDTMRKNFLLQLAQNKRLNVLPEIAELFNSFAAAYEKISTVKVITAVPIQDDYRKKLADALTKRTGQEVIMNCEVDPSILGGAIIYIDDTVIDATVRGDLNRLLESSLR